MSRGSGSSVIPVVVFLALILIVLPVTAENVTPAETTAAPSATTTAVPTTTTAAPATTPATTQTTVALPTTTLTTAETTVSIPATTVTTTTTSANITVTGTRPPTVATTVKPVVSGTVAATTGSVNVYSSPAGASILIDGIYSGTTPNTVNGVPAGNHILRLTLSGYNDYEGSIYIIPGEAAQGYGTLQPISKVTSAAANPTAIVPVIVPVGTAMPVPTQDPGLLGNSTVIAALLGAFAVVVGSAATIFTHIRPPKKE